MIDTKNNVWLTEFTAYAATVKDKSAYDTHRAKERRCPNGHGYIFPDVIYPDAGAIFDAGIVGKHRIEPIAVCPECRARI